VTDTTRTAALAACRTLLGPVASLLLKCGLTWREFAEISKTVFVAVASQEYGLKGRPTNASRVAILTGIDRKEVARQRALLEAEAPRPPGKTTDATRVLSGWHQDPAFLTLAGKPRVLRDGGPGPDFADLCRAHGGDIPPSALRKELLRVGAVAEGPDGLAVVRRYYMPVRFDGQWLANAGSTLRDLGRSISHNLSAADGTPSRFVGRATNTRIDPAALPAFRDFLEAEGQAFLERVDAWLTAHEAAGPDPQKGAVATDPGRTVRLGVGLFAIHGDEADEASDHA
jgi:hypothetical protein